MKHQISPVEPRRVQDSVQTIINRLQYMLNRGPGTCASEDRGKYKERHRNACKIRHIFDDSHNHLQRRS